MADNKKTIKCPACGKEMVKIFVPSEGINLDICVNGCGGIYFDNREFKLFDEPSENIDEILNAIKNKTFEDVDETKVRVCPVCGMKMVKNYSSIKHSVQVDECYGCGGKFLDNKELEKIRDEYKSEAERGADTVKYMYSMVGDELKALDAKVKINSLHKSYAKQFFDMMFYRK